LNAKLKSFYFHFVDDRERMTELLMQKSRVLENDFYVASASEDFQQFEDDGIS